MSTFVIVSGLIIYIIIMYFIVTKLALRRRPRQTKLKKPVCFFLKHKMVGVSLIYDSPYFSVDECKRCGFIDQTSASPKT